MIIQVVIHTDLPTSIGTKVAKHMADALRTQMGVSKWTMHAHIRGPADARVGKDSAYAKYSNAGDR